ncbi:MAG: transposase [Campylobacterales bacterium]|nr:transposase [Campylobacterales bacterium]
MSKYINRLTTKRQFSAVLGVTKEEFKKLLPAFSVFLQKKAEDDYQKSLSTRKRKKRKPSADSSEALKNDKDKLIFILRYLKSYPSFDDMGFTFEMGKTTAEDYVKLLLPVLREAEDSLEVLPKSTIESAEELVQATENNVILVDATERPHYRHKDRELQKKHYSGKQHRHTIKNTIISTEAKGIIYIGNTVPGSMHDYKLFKSEFSTQKDWFKYLKIVVDLGYKGIKKDYLFAENILIPHKKQRKSKNHPEPKLTDEQKKENKKISKKRIYVENAISGMKRFQILVNRLRCKSDFIKDTVIRLAAGLFNLKNNFVVQ